MSSLLRKPIQTLALLFGMYLSVIYIVTWIQGTHFYDFKIENRYLLELKADAKIAFLDWPMEYSLIVTHIPSGKKQDFEFWTGEGPFIRFMVSDKHPDEIWIIGYEQNTMSNWRINIREDIFRNEYPYDSVYMQAFHTIYELDGDYKLQEQKHPAFNQK